MRKRQIIFLLLILPELIVCIDGHDIIYTVQRLGNNERYQIKGRSNRAYHAWLGCQRARDEPAR